MTFPVVNKLNFLEKKTETEELDQLFLALSKAQLEMEVASMDKKNPYFKSSYADLASIVKASRPFLAKNGLCILQRPLIDSDGKTYLYSRLAHSSGQWIEAMMPIIPPKSDIQSLGSYLTYLRRYLYSSLVGVVASDEDDDGEKVMDSIRKKEIPSNFISVEECKILSNKLQKQKEIVNEFFSYFKIKKLSEINKNQFEEVSRWIDEKISMEKQLSKKISNLSISLKKGENHAKQSHSIKS